MKQQEQTFQHFNLNAKDWNEQAKSTNYNTIVDRNNAVIDSVRAHGRVKDFLDVGCGSGQLALQIADLGITSTGIDFAPEMIALCEENKSAKGSTAIFNQVSVFDCKASPNSIDVISAQGFIEYISVNELHQFIEFCGESLRTGGLAVVGSRNRLFNVFSLNDYTAMEAELGTIPQLVFEAMNIQRAQSLTSLFEALKKSFDADHPVSHPFTGVKVATRYQYTPSELIKKFEKAGFEPEKIYPINFQPIPQSLLSNGMWAELKDGVSNFVSNSSDKGFQFIPFSSSFVLAMKKI